MHNKQLLTVLLSLLPCLLQAKPKPGVTDILTNLANSAKDSVTDIGISSAVKSVGSSIAGVFDDCKEAKFANPTDCAILYDDEDCDGWAEPISTEPGYRELGWRRANDAESVVVKKGCTFTGYQHADPDPSKRGRSITVDAKGKSENVAMDFDDSEQLESRISAVNCTCHA